MLPGVGIVRRAGRVVELDAARDRHGFFSMKSRYNLRIFLLKHMKRIIIGVLAACLVVAGGVQAQEQTSMEEQQQRKEIVGVEKETFVYAVKGSDTLRMDRYRVPAMQGDKAAPCLVFVFGGGFAWGERDNADYLPFFEHVARQGFTVAAIDYRLGLKSAVARGELTLERFPLLLAASVRMAEEDLYDATAYLLAEADEWRIDPGRIVTCGSSAGAITVLHAEYDLCNGAPLALQRLPREFNYAGVISFAGAIFAAGEELAWDEAHRPAPMLLFHGDADSNVPYGVIRAMGAGFFGSEYIAGQLMQMRVPHAFYSVVNAGHEMAVQPMDDNRYEIDAFLQNVVLGKQPLVIDTRIESLDRPEVRKQFTLEEYILSNFGGEQ